MSAPLILVDGSSYLYRAFHALPPLTTRDGQPTGAIKGVLSMLHKLVRTYSPEYMAVVFDAPGPTFRDELYPEYKSHRPPMPDDLRAQIAPLHAVVRAEGFPLLMVSGVEADDVIATVVRNAERQRFSVLVATSDKDLAQLVNAQVNLIDTMKDTVMDVDGVMAKFGVPPSRIVDYLALVGDSSDNIPGVPGVGPKTAAKLLSEYGSLDTLLEATENIAGKVGENIRQSLTIIPLARQLATVKDDVELPVGLEGLRVMPKDVPALGEWYERLEFRAWKEALGEQAVQQVVEKEVVTAQYRTIQTMEAFDELLARMKASRHFSFDTETTSLDYLEARIVGVSVAFAPGDAVYIPLAHDYLGAPEQLDRDTALKALKPLLEDPALGKVGQNLKYDAHVLLNHGIELCGIEFDTMLASYVLDATATRHNMDDMAAYYLNYRTQTFEDVAGKGAKQLTFNQVEVEKASFYAAEDADITWRLYEVLAPRLQAEPGLKRIFYELEMPLLPVLMQMERRGALIDVEKLHRQSQEISQRLRQLQESAWVLAGEEFNLASPKQLAHILYEKLAIPAPKKTGTGQYSTAEDVLETLASQHELPKVILEHRGLAKLKSTYTDRLPQQINVVTRRVHTSYHQAVAATGRLSSSDPNLQNIPVRSDEGRRIRQAFVAAPGYQLISADYSQIELRIMAHVSGDAGLLSAFAHGEDVHRATAAEVFGVTREEVTSLQRRAAKAINFGLIYGMSAFGLARQLGIPRKEAESYIDTYFHRYPGVKAYMEKVREQALSAGYVETLFGRRLYVRDIRSKAPAQRAAAERAAINAPMQGTAADIIKRAMLAVVETLQKGGFDAAIILQVHDELVIEVRADQVDAVRAVVITAMQDAADLAVPLEVSAGVGSCWDEAH